MPHICHISTTYNLRSGSARRTSAILRGCIEQGFRTSLIIGRDNDLLQNTIPGINIYIVPELVKYISPLNDLTAPWKIKGILKKIKPDIVHTHLAKAGIVGRLAAAYTRVPHILHTVHGPTFPQRFHPLKRTFFKQLEKVCGCFTDQFVFVGQEIRKEYVKEGICSYKKSQVIHTGRPDSVFDRVRMSENKKKQLRKDICGGYSPDSLIVIVGRIVPSKQLDHAVRVIEALHKLNLNVHLAIVGKCLLEEEKFYENKILQLSNSLNISEFVHFAGFRDEIVDIMEASEAVLLTSQYEGLPNVAVEAAISGTPLFTYDVSGVREIIKQGESGWIYPQGDMNGIVKKLNEVLKYHHENDQEKNRIDYASIASFKESVMVAKKIKLYNDILMKSVKG